MQKIDEDLTCDYLHCSEENLWSILYLTGYLTKVRAESLSEELPNGMTALKIPNAEIKELFEDDYEEILCYGIAFYKKRCLVRKK